MKFRFLKTKAFALVMLRKSHLDALRMTALIYASFLAHMRQKSIESMLSRFTRCYLRAWSFGSSLWTS